MWDKCIICVRPKVCKSNLKKLRYMIGGGVLGGGLLGAIALPLIGFGAGGVAAGSFAASWQSSIGIVAAGSLFATLQSLGATGMGILLFGGIGSALGLLTTLAARLGWCNDDCDYNSAKFEWDRCQKCKKPLIDQSNLLKLRIVAAGGFARGCSEGGDMISLMKLHANANAWYSNIDTFAANRLFDALKSLKDDGLSVLFFGDTESALFLLGTKSKDLDWCKNNCNGAFITELVRTNSIISSSQIILCNKQMAIENTTSNSEETAKNDSKLKDIFSWKRCSKCDRPHVCEPNLTKIRLMAVGGLFGGGALGIAFLPFLGFTAGGVAAGSFAASWQSVIGSVAAGSLFATLQSLGATSLGTLLFGGIGSALGLLATLAARLGWCNDDCDYNSAKFKWETCSKCKKPLFGESNLLKLRIVAASGFARGYSEGGDMIALMRANDNTWYSNIDTFAANRLFDALKSLKDDGLSVLFFGDLRTAMRLVSKVLHKLDWCNNNCKSKNIVTADLVPVSEIVSSSEITLTNIKRSTILPNIRKTSIDENKLKEIFNWKTCSKCDSPTICEQNLVKIRLMAVGGLVGCGVLGVTLLRFLGFANSFAAARCLEKLQSLRATGLGIVLFGEVSSALDLLTTLATILNWCKNECCVK
ncbi:uncharacterized protein LOC116349670 [Contarinia nasturtii]|uniref:uncharacterized protein LOC116349670 n=1 Tax=Contarinia nasturtii TaxID=265458 RepID=UPI0012D4994D|nr:uncharacterized protein LOC116349670 [Contarinia nasturtii]XP_031637075.1 uncharacterized protein LOC116349670 [Contarinia nasturtii]XP_031637076.1 uncharacterized protein LOC116349670 [Contarinia nasturtii]